jgi:hypothetical protein
VSIMGKYKKALGALTNPGSACRSQPSSVRTKLSK